MNAKVVVCSPNHVKLFGDVAESVVAIDHDFIESLAHLPGCAKGRSDSHNAAYIIPTSGTTGQPKLPVIEHGNYCTSAKGQFTGLGMDVCKPLRSLQFAAHSFDASIEEILTPLMVGGTVCIPDETTRLNDIAKAICDMRVTHATLTPTFVRFLEPSMVPTLKTIILMGEAMSQANLETWSKINLVNGYVLTNPSRDRIAYVV